MPRVQLVFPGDFCAEAFPIRASDNPEVSRACVAKPISTIVCSECADAHTYHGEYESLNKDRFSQFSESSESLSVSMHCSNHSPRGILIHPVEDLMSRSFARTLASSAIFMLFPLFAQAQALSFSVGTATAAPGQKQTGYLEVPAGVDAATNIPVIVINGEKRGPVLALVSGAHGTEYTSIIALEKLIDLLNPSQIAGTVILVPLVNIQSFEQKVPHVNPIDNKSMNRFYPGKADGTQTERASFLITKQVVDRCDYLIDYHGGDLDESLRPYAYWAPTGKESQDRISKAMVLAFGLDHIIIWRDRPADLGATRYLDNTSTARGKPSIVVEAGYAGIVETDEVALLVDGTFSTMRALKMLSGDPRPIENPVWLDRVVDVMSDGPGVWYPLVKRGTYVQEGMKIGFVTDYFGKLILEARAPVSGVILHINAVPSLKKGDNIADIAAIAAHAP